MRRFGGFLLATLLVAPFTMAAAKDFNLIVLDGKVMKWGPPTFGAPASVTYAFASGEFRDPGARNCTVIGSITGLSDAMKAPVSAVEDEAAAAFAMWEDAAGIRFTRIDDMTKADIVIGVQMAPTGYAFTNVRYDGAPENVAGAEQGKSHGLNQPPDAAALPHQTDGATPLASLHKSLICFNPERPWKIGFGGNANAYDIRYTFAHEIGHAIGLDHMPGRKLLMNFKYTEAFRGPQAGDITGARYLYGPPAAEPTH